MWHGVLRVPYQLIGCFYTTNFDYGLHCLPDQSRGRMGDHLLHQNIDENA